MLKTTICKVNGITQQYGLSQMVKDPTHFTENSSSLIDLFLVKHPSRVAHCGVAEPFLEQNVRYHCPIFIILNYFKPPLPSFKGKYISLIKAIMTYFIIKLQTSTGQIYLTLI